MPIFLVSLLLWFSSMAFGSPVEQLTHKFLADGGEIEYQKKELGAAHQIVLSAPKRINNELYVEKDKRVNGELNVSLLRLSPAIALSDASDYVEKLMQENGQVTYRCQQRACGVSSYWANNLFDERRLSGRDSDQFYLAGSIKYGGAEYWLSAYLVSNALRQHLVYIRYIKKELDDVGWSNGYLFSADQTLPENVRSLLQERLETDSELALYLAAYVDGKKVNAVGQMQKLVNEPFKILQSKLSESLLVSPNRIHFQFVGAFHTQLPIESKNVWFRLFLYKQ